LADAKQFRVMCTSADQANAEFRYFDSQTEAEAWAFATIETDQWGQVAVQRKSNSGEWESTPNSVHKANR
jgi:hypothetical protein